MRLVVVESPTKAKTLSKFLGRPYSVQSSYGHIRDLPEKELGVDTRHKFKPKYVIPAKARKKAKVLKDYASKAKLIILATDEDREGEAIAWHILQIINDKRPYERIVFHEITKRAIEQALKNPRKIDMDLVDAQQTRRILDRLVGYKLSPFLWRKVAKGLSAGRVQSVAVRLIADREREIEKFKPEEFWQIEAEFKERFKAALIKQKLKNKKETDKVLKDLKGAAYKVIDVKRKEVKRNPYPPFTTSTLQQEAARRLGYSAKKTMFVAQQLYEKGFITYHRTDSLNLSQDFLKQVKKYLEPKYLQTRIYKAKKTAQEAHEAIRPTKISRKVDDKLYDLIWCRAIASQMTSAILDSTTVDIQAKKYLFRAFGSILKFDGFLKIYPLKITENLLPQLSINQILKLLKLIPSQHFTQPPPRYTEATLVKALENYGIGRPSTYAPILSTIQERGYVAKIKRKLYPQEIGLVVNDLLCKHFPKIVDIKFTAQMENDLDKIAQGKVKWVPVIDEFYRPFKKNLLNKDKEIKKMVQKTSEKCEKCGKPMVIRTGRYGKFLACTGFPECRFTKPIIKSTGQKCPDCKKGEVIEKRTRKGKVFWGCSQYPKCEFATWEKPEK